MNPTHTGPIGYTKLMLWLHKYKVGHIDLILMTPKSPENLNFPMCHTLPPLINHVLMHPGHSI